MGFFNVGGNAGSKWTVTPDIWVYFVVAVPITALTLFYLSWKSPSTRIRQADDSPV